MDTFLLVATIIIAVILIFVNFYLLALYCHRIEMIITNKPTTLGGEPRCSVRS